MTDDELRARLRRADPARSLAPVATDRLSRLLEDAMTAEPTPPRPAPKRRLLLTAAAAVAVLAAGTAVLVSRLPEQRPGPGAVAVPQRVTRLSAAGMAAKCVEPTPDVLAASADFAFAGTVVGIADGLVTLRVTRVYTGASADVVQVVQTGDISEGLVGGSDRFESDRDYLVASARGQVMICGYSGTASATGLRDLYDKAF